MSQNQTRKMKPPTPLESHLMIQDLDPKSCLCELTDAEISGPVQDVLRNLGYDESASTVLGRIHGWQWTVEDFGDWALECLESNPE